MEMNGGIDMESRILTEADCDPEWIGQYWDYEGRYQRFICWDENNNKPTYWDAEACQWEGEKHKIPTTGTWIEHPYKPIIADAWLPDPSKFADPADAQYDAYWDEGNEGGKRSNPAGLPKNPALFPGGKDFTAVFAEHPVPHHTTAEVVAGIEAKAVAKATKAAKVQEVA